MPEGRLYKLVIKAEGELRDKDGNLISVDPITFEERIVTEAEAQAIAASLSQQQGSTHGSRPISDEPG